MSATGRPVYLDLVDLAARMREQFGEDGYAKIIGGTPPEHDWRFEMTSADGQNGVTYDRRATAAQIAADIAREGYALAERPDPPRSARKGYNGTGVPCRAADLEGRVGERLEIEVYDNVTEGKTISIIGCLDGVDDFTAMVSALWSPWQVSINVHDVANVWTAEPR